MPSVRNFPQSTLITLRATNSCIALLNIFGNGFLIYALKKTGQTTSLSMQLIILMSSSDCMSGIVALVLINMLLWKTYDSNCTLKVITQFIQLAFVCFSFTTVLLIAIDRYLHIRYLQRYPIIVTMRRGRIVVLATLIYQLLVAFTSSMPFLKNYVSLAKLVQTFGATVGMLAVFILYYKTTKTVKSRVSSMNDLFMKSTMVQAKTLSNAALSISICTAMLLTPYVISVIILDISKIPQVQNSTKLAIFRWFTYVSSLANGFCSCIIFIVQNKPVKRLIKEVMMN